LFKKNSRGRRTTVTDFCAWNFDFQLRYTKEWARLQKKSREGRARTERWSKSEGWEGVSRSQEETKKSVGKREQEDIEIRLR
jgi:hypothetical protein